MASVQDFCRMCLQETDPYNSRKIDLRKLCTLWKFYKFDKMDASFYRNHLICDACIVSLKALKSMFFNAKNSQDEILQEMKKNNLEKINLKKMSRYSKIKNEFLVCRLCLRDTKEVALYLYDNSENILPVEYIRKMFLACKINMNFTNTINPISCDKCWENIQIGFSFWKHLEKVNQKVISYAKAMNKAVITREDLQKIINLYSIEDPVRIKSELDLLVKKESIYYSNLCKYEDVKPKIEPESPSNEKYFNPFRKLIREGPIDDLHCKPIITGHHDKILENQAVIQEKIVINPYHDANNVVLNPLYERILNLLSQNNVTLTKRNKISENCHKNQNLSVSPVRNSESQHKSLPCDSLDQSPNDIDINVSENQSFEEIHVVEESIDEGSDVHDTNDKEPPYRNDFGRITVRNDIQIKKEVIWDEDILEEEVHIKREVSSDHEADGNDYNSMSDDDIFVEDNNFLESQTEHIDLDTFPNLDIMVKNEPINFEDHDVYDIHYIEHFDEGPPVLERQMPCIVPKKNITKTSDIDKQIADTINSLNSPRSLIPLKKKRGRPNGQISTPHGQDFEDSSKSSESIKRLRGRPKRLNARNLIEELSKTNELKSIPKLAPVVAKISTRSSKKECKALNVTKKTRNRKPSMERNTSNQSLNIFNGDKHVASLLENPLNKINTRSKTRDSIDSAKCSVIDRLAEPVLKKKFRGSEQKHEIDGKGKHLQKNHEKLDKIESESSTIYDGEFYTITAVTSEKFEKELVINLPKLENEIERLEENKAGPGTMPVLNKVAEDTIESKPDAKDDSLKPQTRLRHLTYFSYECEPCGFKTFNKLGAEMHKTKHANNSIRSYACPKCPFMAYSVARLKEHVKKEHPEHNFKNVSLPGHCFYCKKICVLQIKCRKCKNIFHFGCFSRNLSRCQHEEDISIKAENMEHSYSASVKKPKNQNSPKNHQKIQPMLVPSSTSKTLHNGEGPSSPPALEKEPNTLDILTNNGESAKIVQNPPSLNPALTETESKSKNFIKENTKDTMLNQSSPAWDYPKLFENLYTDLRVEKIVESNAKNDSNIIDAPPLLENEASQLNTDEKQVKNTHAPQKDVFNKPDARPPVLHNETSQFNTNEKQTKITKLMASGATGLKNVLYPVKKTEICPITPSTSKKRSSNRKSSRVLKVQQKFQSRFPDFERVQNTVTKPYHCSNLEKVDLNADGRCFDATSKQLKREVLDSFGMV